WVYAMTRKDSNRVREATHFPAFDMGAPGALPVPEASPGTSASFRQLVKRLSEAHGPSGSEEAVRDLARAEISSAADQVRTDAFGNLIAFRKGNGNQHRQKIMLAAHLDEIGVMVTFLDARGFARFGMLGAVKPLTLLGARCQFANGTMGIFGRELHGASRTEIETDKLFIDVGATAPENASVRVGDAACFVGAFQEAGDFWRGKALASRAGCAILIETLRRLKKSAHDVYCVFTAQQEVGARGASAAAFAIQPDYAFVLDAAPAHDLPSAKALDIAALALGNGPAIKFQDEHMIASPAARQILIHAARDARVPYQVLVSTHAGGDGAMMQASREGILTGALALPARYLRTPSEMIHAQDVENAIQLAAQILATKAF
ncbi:MAG: hypothetical protein L0Y55_06220, partial [Anaerolineales bacterium]|nr:hypothetical protein [Anaerolineales bacterium]